MLAEASALAAGSASTGTIAAAFVVGTALMLVGLIVSWFSEPASHILYVFGLASWAVGLSMLMGWI